MKSISLREIQSRSESKESFNTIHYVLDRITLSKAFQRLGGKTQIFPAGSHDHVQNRLTHTLCVTNISRFMARRLRLNELISEVIALSHDIGHTPFGHAGERVINQVMNGCLLDGATEENIKGGSSSCGLGFKHNLQSAYLCIELENILKKQNANATDYSIYRILYGIINHSDVNWDECKNIKAYEKSSMCKCSLSHYNDVKKAIRADSYTIESELVAIADEIAQRQHDILDAYYMRIMSFEEIKKLIKPVFNVTESILNDEYKICKEGQHKAILKLSLLLANAYITNIITTSREYMKSNYDNMMPNQIEILRKLKPIRMSNELREIDENIVKSKLMTTVLNSHYVQRLDGVADYVIRKLYAAYLENPMQLYDPSIVTIMNRYNKAIHKPNKYSYDLKDKIGKARKDMQDCQKQDSPDFKGVLLRGITDHIAGMTDAYALNEYKQLYGHEFTRM